MTRNKTDEPLEPVAGSPGQNSRLRAATKNQSSVRPDDYPEEERKLQAKAAGKTGDTHDRR